jgi:hypothetical protein
MIEQPHPIRRRLLGHVSTSSPWLLFAALLLALSGRSLAQQSPRPDAVQQGQTPSPHACDTA